MASGDEHRELPDGPEDPEELALLLVQQYLKERGYSQALAATEAVHGLKYVDYKLPRASMLMELLYSHMEGKLRASELGVEEARALETEERLLQGGEQDFPDTLVASVSGLHDSNIISIAVVAGTGDVITGAGSGSVSRIDLQGPSCTWATPLGGGAALCLHLLPLSSCVGSGSGGVGGSSSGSAGGQGNEAGNPPRAGGSAESDDAADVWVAVGSMDGSVCVLDGSTGNLLGRNKAHSKYVVSVRWLPTSGDKDDGTDGPSASTRGSTAAGCVCYFASGSWDHTVAIYSVTRAEGALQLEAVRCIPYANQVTALEVLPPGLHTLVVAVRGSSYLRTVDTQTFKEAARHNMNAQQGDEFVSFCALHLSLSPDGRYLLIATDKPRVILMDTHSPDGWSQTRNFYDLTVEQYQNPCVAWHRGGFYVFAAAAAGWVYVYHVGTTRCVAKIKAHDKNIRGLAYDPAANRLVTCSFDRTIKVLE